MFLNCCSRLSIKEIKWGNMKVKELLDKLDFYVLDYNLVTSDCDLENGLRFFLPPSNTATQGTVFAGTVTEWKYLYNHKKITTNATYLLCCEKGDSKILPRNSVDANVILLNISVSLLPQVICDITLEKEASCMLPSKLYKSFWEGILSFRITTQSQVLSKIKDFPYSLHQHIACIVLRDSNYSNHANADEVFHNLQNFFPNTNLFEYNNEWIILYSQSKDTSDILDFSYESFSNLLENHHLLAGISYACQLPEILHTLYLTASNSISLGTQLNITTKYKNIYTYHELNPYYLIHLCTQPFFELHKTNNLIYLAHPDVARIYFYDLGKNTNLLDVLFTYLTCGQNVGQAAAKLYMHRNTVLNKLNKIEAIVQHKLDYEHDSFLILLSCMVLKYQHRFSSKKLEDYFAIHDFLHELP